MVWGVGFFKGELSYFSEPRGRGECVLWGEQGSASRADPGELGWLRRSGWT